MPSREIYDRCLRSGYPVHLNPYERYDSLASEDDLELFFGLLGLFTDSQGNNPVITANCVVANPDFEKIKNADFNEYHFESIVETFKKYPKHSKCFDLWKDGYSSKVFFPQFHAREHLNVSKFMQALSTKNMDAHFAFNSNMPGSISRDSKIKGNLYVEATHYKSDRDKTNKLNIYLEGLDLFEKLFGYKSKSIVPTNYIWSPDYFESISKKGVEFIQGTVKYREPNVKKDIYHKRFMGQKNAYNQIDLLRNCTFEPTTSGPDSLKNCLSDIDIAFRMKKPAIICTHRINYVGYISQTNRDKNLKTLNYLIKAILKKWPETEFMNSVTLGELIKNENSNTSF